MQSTKHKTKETQGRIADIVNLSILLTVALCIGIYLIVMTTLVAKDGVTFIKYGQRIESEPVKTMLNEFQHPGYPWLILTAHKMTGLLHKNTPILSWVYCAQSVTLIFRLLAITVLYFIGKRLFGNKMSFWGVLILILLPKPAEYGSDALSDWPHLFFLAAGMLLLFKVAEKKSGWMFGFVGLAAGAGYLIRPECVQLVVLGGLWLGLQLLWQKRVISRAKSLSGLALMLLGFMVIAGPYMNLKGAVFPKKKLVQSQPQVVLETIVTADIVSPNIAKAIVKLFENTGETLMWFFVPALFIGMYKWFRERKWHEPEKFLVLAVVILNIPIMILLHCKYGYMSLRHTLPLLILPILYIPVGLQETAIWCRKRFSRKVESLAVTNRNERFWFLVLLLIGVSICTPKLFRPIRAKKQGYRAVAKWLKANTGSATTIAVPDKRISFYAQRKELVYENDNIPQKAEYIVKRFRKQKHPLSLVNPSGRLEYEYIDKRGKGINVAIYKRLEKL